MTLQQHKFFISINIAFLASISFLLYDTSAYLSALFDLTKPSFVSSLHKEIDEIESDMSNYEACKKFKDADNQFHSNDARQCLLDAMPKTKSISGALVFSTAAVGWLMDHPADTQIRTTALQMINNGRQAIESTRKRVSISNQQINKAWNQSIILSAFKKADESNLSETQTDLLNKAEQRIINPGMLIR